MKLFRMFGRSIRDAFKSVIRNFSLSIASISCISITLIIVAASIIASSNVNNFTTLIEKDVTIVAFMNRDTNKEGLKTFETELSKIKNVASVKYKSKEESKKEMMKESDLFASTMGEWSEKDNPLRDSYLIKVKDIESAIASLKQEKQNLKKLAKFKFIPNYITSFKEDEDFRKYKMTGRKVIAAETIDEMCQYEVPKVLFKTTLEKSEEIESYLE